MSLARLAFAALVLWGGWQWWSHRAAQQPEGVLAAREPLQQPSTQAPFNVEGLTLTPRADFTVEARVLSLESYRMDREAVLSPLDAALGWGPMSDSRVLNQLDISQSGRFFYWHSAAEPPLPVPEIVRHAANMHLIPADSRVRKALFRLRVGQVVRLDGLLVDAQGDNGWHWNTSLTREDSGGGACELFWVRAVAVTLSGS